jgi:cyanophycinase
MGKSDSILISIGGGEMTEAPQVMDEILGLLKKKEDAGIVVMTVATNEPESAADKYRSLFRGRGVKHVNVVDISEREHGFDEASLKKVREADALFFTGGDQLNVTSLMGGTPLHNLIQERFNEGFIIAGTSAGAAMMSSWMIISGGAGNPPMVGGVEFAPGMDLMEGTVIDTHFSQRARHGRLLTAVAHYPQAIGIGIDERTAMVVRRNEFKVIGEGIVTVVDGARMQHCDLPYRENQQPIGMFDVAVHVLPAGYKYDLKTRRPIAPTLTKLAGTSGG